jgi:N-acetylmuramoyl-L-alanine amidase
MALLAARSEEEKLLARLMRAEAEGDGELGMIMAGTVGVNRVLADCLDFRNIRTITDMVYQSPGGFEAVQKPYFYQAARSKDLQLARRVLRGELPWPATDALWFLRTAPCPAQWYGQYNVGRYKSHCFYRPTPSACPSVYRY